MNTREKQNKNRQKSGGRNKNTRKHNTNTIKTQRLPGGEIKTQETQEEHDRNTSTAARKYENTRETHQLPGGNIKTHGKHNKNIIKTQSHPSGGTTNPSAKRKT